MVTRDSAGVGSVILGSERGGILFLNDYAKTMCTTTPLSEHFDTVLFPVLMTTRK